MAFSDSIEEVGAFRWKKILHLLGTILWVAYSRILTGSRVLYYPPAGPKKNAFYRDVAILIATRWMFHKTVFHFYAAGVADLYGELPWWGKILYRAAYGRADSGLALFQEGLRDPEFLGCAKSVVIPCGCPDLPPADLGLEDPRTEPVVLFLAMLSDSKGVFVFLDACAELVRRGIALRPVLVGWAESAAFERELEARVEELNLKGILERHGKTVGEEKYAIYRRASVFCFPTFYPSEGSPVVLLEAMQFGLPIVATDWRGCSDIVVDGETGFLVPIKNTAAVAEKLETLLKDHRLLKKMGRAGRERYQRLFTVEAFRCLMEKVLASV